MTMHMVHPGLTTLRTDNKRKKLTAKQQKAKEDHDAWLRKQGLHPDQLAARAGKKRPSKLEFTLTLDDSSPKCGNGFAPGGYKKSVFDSQWQRTYDDDPLLAEREADALKKAEALKSQLAPLYNKGPIQVVTPGHNLKDGNGRGKR